MDRKLKNVTGVNQNIFDMINISSQMSSYSNKVKFLLLLSYYSVVTKRSPFYHQTNLYLHFFIFLELQETHSDAKNK